MEQVERYPPSSVVNAAFKTSDTQILRALVESNGLLMLQRHIAKSAEQNNGKRVEAALMLLQKLPVKLSDLLESQIGKCIKKVGKQASLGKSVEARACFLQARYRERFVSQQVGQDAELIPGEMPKVTKEVQETPSHESVKTQQSRTVGKPHLTQQPPRRSSESKQPQKRQRSIQII